MRGSVAKTIRNAIRSKTNEPTKPQIKNGTIVNFGFKKICKIAKKEYQKLNHIEKGEHSWL